MSVIETNGDSRGVLKVFQERVSNQNLAKISFNIILLNLAIRIIAIFLLIDLFVFSSCWVVFHR